ncbi:Hypothetical protein FKW44_015455, partial [Caligus rogercresseyi]
EVCIRGDGRVRSGKDLVRFKDREASLSNGGSRAVNGTFINGVVTKSLLIHPLEGIFWGFGP